MNKTGCLDPSNCSHHVCKNSDGAAQVIHVTTGLHALKRTWELYKKQGLLGFANLKVYHIRERRPKQEKVSKMERKQFAAKVQPSHDGIECAFLREYTTLAKLQQCPYIVPLQGAIVSLDKNPKSVLLFPLASTDLEKYIVSMIEGNTTWKPKLLKRFMWQMLTAVDYCHQHLVIHRDIKPENVLLFDDEDQTQVKLTDFGLARRIGLATSNYTKEIATRQYRAPEIFSNAVSYTTAVDVWGLGAVFFEMVSGHELLPLHELNDMTMLNAIFQIFGVPSNEVWQSIAPYGNIIPEWPANASPRTFPALLKKAVSSPWCLTLSAEDKIHLSDLLPKMLCVDPRERISTAAALKHPFFSQDTELTLTNLKQQSIVQESFIDLLHLASSNPPLIQADSTKKECDATMVHRDHMPHVRRNLLDQDKPIIPTDYFPRHAAINPEMRSILVNWLVEVTAKCNSANGIGTFGANGIGTFGANGIGTFGAEETFFRAIRLLDGYLACSKEPLTRNKLQLIGITALFTSSKIEQYFAEEGTSMVHYCKNAYTLQQIHAMEAQFIDALNPEELNGPLWIDFVPLAITAIGSKLTEDVTDGYTVRSLTRFILYSVAVVGYGSCVQHGYRPFDIAASAVILALHCVELSKNAARSLAEPHHKEGKRQCWYSQDAAESNAAIYEHIKKVYTAYPLHFSDHPLQSTLLRVKNMVTNIHMSKLLSTVRIYSDERMGKVALLWALAMIDDK
jgi:serine/threonine protein kinase